MAGLNPTHTYIKDGIYYYGRKVPKDLREHYIKDRIVMSLRTKSVNKASIASNSITAKLDAYWLNLRLSSMEVPAAHLLASNVNIHSNVITLSAAKDEYVQIKGKGRSKTFFSSSDRNIKYAIECLGDRALDQYSTTDGGIFREWLKDKSMSTSTIRRVFNTIKAIVALAISEHGLGINNPFSGIYIEEHCTSAKRQPVSLTDTKSIQDKCYTIDDDLRWLLALITDTGMRLAEAVGLHISDININDTVPNVVIQPHEWRSLKTSTSTRTLPLVGASLWAAKRIVSESKSEFCFERYCNETRCNANSASAALNKWLKVQIGPDATIHGFRHGMRDRLRAIQCPTEIIDICGGWAHRNIGSQYGNGYPIEVVEEWMSKM